MLMFFALTNTLAYLVTELITTIKSFMIQTPRVIAPPIDFFVTNGGTKISKSVLGLYFIG